MSTPSTNSTGPGGVPRRAWLATTPLGTRVVVRYLIEDGERATDVVGELVEREASSLTVVGRRGPVRVEIGDVVVAKPVPPVGARWRIASFLRRAGVAVLDLDGLLRALEAVADRDAATAATVGLVDQLEASGIPVVVLAREVLATGEDRARKELEPLGLGPLVPHLLDAGRLAAEPGAEDLSRVHDAIEERLGRTVGVGTVHFTDDRPGAVEAARDFGWQARVLTLP